MGVDIIAIRRGRDWMVNPEDNEKILRDDILIARGAPQGINRFRELAEGKIRKMEA